MGKSREGPRTAGLICRLVLVPLLLYVANTVTDLLLAVMYFPTHKNDWFAWMLGFVLGPSLIIQLISLFYKRKDRQQCRPVVYVLHVLQLGVFIQYGALFLHLWLGVGGSESGRVSPGLPIIHLTEAVLQSVPQLSLQFYVTILRLTKDNSTEAGNETMAMCNNTTWATTPTTMHQYNVLLNTIMAENTTKLQNITVAMSTMYLNSSTETDQNTPITTSPFWGTKSSLSTTPSNSSETDPNEENSSTEQASTEQAMLVLKSVSMSVSLIAAVKAVVVFFYNRSLRKENLSIAKLLARMLLITVWKLLELCARAFAIGLFTSATMWIGMSVLAAQWLAMTIAIVTMRHAWRSPTMLMCSLAAAVDTFSTTWSIFYQQTFWLNTALTLMGNTAMIVGWSYFQKNKELWCKINIPALTFVICASVLSAVLGIVEMFLEKRIRCYCQEKTEGDRKQSQVELVM